MTEKNKKIIVVEDDETIGGMYTERLIQEGYSVTLVTDGEKALEIIQHHGPDLVVLDIMLPKKNGLEVLEIIRSTPHISQVPVVVLSALPKSEYEEKINHFGAAGFYNKAVTLPKDIAFEINEILDTK